MQLSSKKYNRKIHEKDFKNIVITSLLEITEQKECLDKNPLGLNVKAKTSGRPIREL